MTKAALVSQCPGLQDYWTKLVLSNATTLVAQCPGLLDYWTKLVLLNATTLVAHCPGLQGHSDKDCTYVLQD